MPSVSTHFLGNMQIYVRLSFDISDNMNPYTTRSIFRIESWFYKREKPAMYISVDTSKNCVKISGQVASFIRLSHISLVY